MDVTHLYMHIEERVYTVCEVHLLCFSIFYVIILVTNENYYIELEITVTCPF